MTDLKTGDVLELPVGLRCYHNQGMELTEIKTPVIVVVETTRHIEPFSVTGAEGHFERCHIIKARALNPDGSYFPEGALLTFVQYGDFRPEYILPENPKAVLRRMHRTFIRESV